MGPQCWFDLHYTIICLEKTIFCLLLGGLLRQVLLYTIKFNGYPIWEVKNNKFPTDRPVPVKQGRVRGNKNIFKVGLKFNPYKPSVLFVGNRQTVQTQIRHLRTRYRDLNQLHFYIFSINLSNAFSYKFYWKIQCSNFHKMGNCDALY